MFAICKTIFVAGLLAALTQSALADPGTVYDQAFRATVLVVNTDEQASGTGVLISSDLRLVATAAHVVGESRQLFVFFPVINEQGNVIGDREFYYNQDNFRPLHDAGLMAVARVAAINHETDMAILQLDVIPDGVQPVELAEEMPTEGDKLHLIGHPAGRNLWAYSMAETITVGHQDVHVGDATLSAEMVEMYGSGWPGNSGGPVLNDEGQLVGIMSTIDGGKPMYNTAILAVELAPLADGLQPLNVVAVANRTNQRIAFKFRWADGQAWDLNTLEPGEVITFWSEDLELTSPQIEFDAKLGSGEKWEDYHMTPQTILIYGRPQSADAQVFYLDYSGESHVTLLQI